MIALCVDHSHVHKIWPNVFKTIRRAIQRGDLGRFDELERAVLNGHALVWLAVEETKVEGVAVTQIVLTENSKVCMVQACGGKDCSHWLHLLADIEQYAKAQGCDCTRIMGRKGWARVLKNYKTTKIVLERRL